MSLAVIKVGGSLMEAGGLDALCDHLSGLSSRHPMLIVPGGGPFADAVRHADRTHHLSDDAAHWMAVLAMNQYGYLIADRMPGGRMVQTMEEIQGALAKQQIPIWLPFEMVCNHDPLPHTWSVTSDAIAAWVARQLQADMLVLVKDVDGLYDASAGLEKPNGPFLKTIRLDQLATSAGVDAYLASLMETAQFPLWVVNGLQPKRVSTLLATGQTTGTCLDRSRF
jgi:5-(aminomethyl)-3-furanmethanol phosphate kinase